ncbi:DUF6285 domain-containing protein [Novosphingobium sp. 9U]|uniref:DUF6285 domain-containing protein n=1 Tax=Novosphingobium sp. 9U TaxID=2653158 RepID=UPI0012F3C0FA|nr:DUF6285 domain-containing protein [Novosphingobium sp. 9U]VWX50288.1 conserved hypothetical protein [Novosphingobium sp. 9U]
MSEQIDAQVLIATVVRWLREEAVEALSGAARFDARVAANALEIAAREFALGPAAADRESERLAALLGDEKDLEAMRAELCQRLSSGAIDASDPALLRHLRESVLDQVEIDQPRYSAYRRARGEA